MWPIWLTEFLVLVDQWDVPLEFSLRDSTYGIVSEVGTATVSLRDMDCKSTRNLMQMGGGCSWQQTVRGGV